MSKPFVPDLNSGKKKKPETVKMSRAERRIVTGKRNLGTPGSNRKTSDGRQVQQQHKLGVMTVGEDPRLVTVASIVTGKGGRKKVVARKTVLSRKIIALKEVNLNGIRFEVEANKKDLTKSEIKVLTVSNGRSYNS